MTSLKDRAMEAGISTALGYLEKSPEENLPRIFDRFFTIDKSHNGKNGGFGLGLSVVKKLCKKQGWTLTVESKEGVGSTFRIGFPAMEPPQNADPASADRK